MRHGSVAVATAVALTLAALTMPTHAANADKAGSASPDTGGAGGAGLLVQWRVRQDVGSTFLVTVAVRNETKRTMSDWSIELPFRHEVTQIRGGVGVQGDSTLTLARKTPLAAGQDAQFTLTVTSIGPVSRVPSTCVSPSSLCRVVLPGDSDQAPRIPSGGSSGAPTGKSGAGSTNGSGATPEAGASDRTHAPEPRNEGGRTPDASGTPDPDGAGPDVDEGSPGSGTDVDSDPSTAIVTPGTGDTPEVETPTPKARVTAGTEISEVDEAKAAKASRKAKKKRKAAARRAKRAGQSRPSLAIRVQTVSDWGSGQSVRVTVRNDGPKRLKNWTIAVPWVLAVDKMWNAVSTSGGGVVRASNADWNGALRPGEAIEFGFNATPGTSAFRRDQCFANTDLGATHCTVDR